MSGIDRTLLIGIRIPNNPLITSSQVESGSTPHLAPFVGRTYESFEALLIGVSPVYVRKMTEEVGRRFAERLEGVRKEHDSEGEEGQGGEKQDREDLSGTERG